MPDVFSLASDRLPSLLGKSPISMHQRRSSMLWPAFEARRPAATSGQKCIPHHISKCLAATDATFLPGQAMPLMHAGEPATTPSRCVLPEFNTMALFAVLPGRSFHSVQEVFNPDKPRLSISGWYHGTTPPEGSEQATLAQLKAAPSTPAGAPGAGVAAGAAFEVFPPLPHAVSQESARLSSDEREFLARWINPLYLERGSIGSMVAQWEKSSCVQLHKFLRQDVADRVRRRCRRFACVSKRVSVAALPLPSRLTHASACNCVRTAWCHSLQPRAVPRPFAARASARHVSSAVTPCVQEPP